MWKIFSIPRQKKNGPFLIWPITGMCSLPRSRFFHTLVSPARETRVCAAEQGMVFRVLRLKQSIQFYYSASWKGCVLDRKPLRECEGCRWTVYICGTASAAHLYTNFPSVSLPPRMEDCVTSQKNVCVWGNASRGIAFSPFRNHRN